MEKYIVSTTINPPTLAMMKFLQKTDWRMIIVGDLKTPHEEYWKLEKNYPQLRYLAPEQQEKRYKVLSDAIGWNKIMRRNIGFCEAYLDGADVVATVDDDNIPYQNWGEHLCIGQELELDCYDVAPEVFDPLSVTNLKHLWHRGYPMELVPSRHQVTYHGKIRRKVLIQAELWDGVPDIDAMGRMIYAPREKLNVAVPFCSTKIAPFNSQNTFLAREVLPHYMCIPHVGRMDDIWGGYMAQMAFPESLVFMPATVYQDRNEPHSRNIKDLQNEMLGYERTLDFLHGDFKLPEMAKRAYDAYQAVFAGGR